MPNSLMAGGIPPAGSSTPVPIVGSPYPGLRSFERHEANIFFGRETHIDAMIDRMAEHRFLAVTGSSGSGKSSLVRVGLLEGLDTGLLATAGSLWRIAELRPGQHPMAELAAALASALGGEASPESIALRRAALDRGPLSLVEELRERPLLDGANLLILVDQFEELFRYQGLSGREEAEAFVALLLASAAQRELPIYVLVTMRSDFLGRCAEFAGLAETVTDAQYLCPRLSREQIAAAIRSPAQVFGGRVEPELAARLVNDMGTDPDQLPLMQHALMRLWNQALECDPSAPLLRLDDYVAAGGLKGSLSHHADEILEEVARAAPQRLEIAYRLFCLAIEGEGEHAVRRPAPVRQVMAVTRQPFDEVAATALAFRAPGRTLLMPPPGQPFTPESLLDISHEALIRNWETLKGWVRDEAASAAQYRETERRARRWAAGQAPLWDAADLDIALAWRERERPTAAWASRYGGDFALAMRFLDESVARRDAMAARLAWRRRALVAAMAALIVVFGGLAWFGLDRATEARVQSAKALALQRDAEQAAKEANERKIVAQQQQELAQAETVKANQAVILAQRAWNQYLTSRKPEIDQFRKTGDVSDAKKILENIEGSMYLLWAQADPSIEILSNQIDALCEFASLYIDLDDIDTAKDRLSLAKRTSEQAKLLSDDYKETSMIATIENRLKEAESEKKAVAVASTALGGDSQQGLHLGVNSCGGSNCHAAERPISGVRIPQNEFRIWKTRDKHSQAYAALLGPQALKIAKSLGLPTATEAKRCLECHTDNVPPAMRGPTFDLTDGVGCEACHGGASRWLAIHLVGASSHEMNVQAGLYPIEQPDARAYRCLNCHSGSDKSFASLVTAGHPQISFELDTYTAIQPAHFVVTPEYIQRKGRITDLQIWTMGQTIAVSEQMNAILDPDNQGYTPLQIDQTNTAMLQVIAARLLPETAPALDTHLLALRGASSRDAVTKEALAIRDFISTVTATLYRHTFDRADAIALADGVVATGAPGVDYSVAAQATLAMQSIIAEMKSSDYATEDQIKVLEAALSSLMATVANRQAFNPVTFAQALHKFQAVLPR